ncbi:MAG: RagB/SusD family nutrient uptake outer membrane protein [Lewinellaceae bacterium]|nr:RagB/SusD family nutrient uptake outer membrane protein [Phaeodactylibacter sp.]MCB0613156.1 RagB/SusD family nutrient uptake outer membrane protein [Phaeodactylibacter sp.]MCB9349385.1 RagB/SusD family nutrient uptake outer membrane protein [Lewinellaceae bacterium]
MKKYSKILLMLIGTVLSACTDLELSPQSEAVPDVVFQDPDSYRQFLAKIYAGLATTGQQGPAGSADIQGIDEGVSSYTRMLFYAEELPTETAHVGWNDQTIKSFAFHTWNSDDPFITGLYYRLFYQVTIANEFLRESTEGKLDSRGFNGEVKAEVASYRNEARFVRALAYWHALNLFRNIPFFTEEDALGAEAPAQGTPLEVFNFIESELLAIENALPGPGENEYARADRAAAWALLAKLYLNAEVYIGQNRYSDCLNYCSKIIDSGVYSLNPVFQNNFNADNHTSPEFIFPVAFDGTRTQGYGGTTFLTHAVVGGDMSNDDYGIDNGWGGVRTTRQFVELFPDVTGDIDSRAIFFTQGQNIDVTVENVGDFTNGYPMPKFTNITSDGDPGSNLGFPDTDFPMFRLADIYLMYAECVVRGGGGDMGTAVDYVNLVRERAYRGPAGDITEAELTLDFLLDERGRELAYECHRRTDRIRFGQFTVAGLWQLKGETDEGAPTPEWRNIYPIPSAEIIANPKLDQNPNY